MERLSYSAPERLILGGVFKRFEFRVVLLRHTKQDKRRDERGEMTKRWLKRVRRTADPAGDLIAILRRHTDDADLPRPFRHIGAMRAYLRSKGASHEALAAVTVVWERYTRWLHDHPFDDAR